MKTIRTGNPNRTNTWKTYFLNGEKIADVNFKLVTEIEGNIWDEQEVTADYFVKMIDEYAWAIDNGFQRIAAEAKNARIKAFLGI